MSQFDTVNLMKAFAEAGSAMEELPKTRADLEAANSLLNETNERLNAERATTEALRATIAQLEADLSAKEAALADATKSSQQREALLDGLRALLGSNRGDSRNDAAAVTVAVPSQPQEEPLGNDSNITGPSVEASSNTDQKSTESGAASADTLADLEVAAPPVPLQPSNLASDSPASTASSTDPTESEATELAPQTGDADSQRYDGRDFMSKPANMSWREFGSLGGVIPYWVYDLDAA